MQKATHINVGLTVTLGLILAYSRFDILFPFYVLIALLPDLDHGQSTLNKKFGIKLPFKHRGFTHTLLFIILCVVLLALLFYAVITWIQLDKTQLLIWFILFHSHILWDLFTVSWIPYFWPVFKNFRIPWISIIKTGTSWEWFFNLWISGLNIWLIYFLLQNEIWKNEGFINSVKIVNSIVAESPTTLFVTLGLFLFLVVHLISSELKNVKKDITNLWAYFTSLFSVVLSVTVIVWLIWFALVKLTTFPLEYVYIGSVVAIAWTTFIKLYQNIEFVSKSFGYIINFIALAIFTILMFIPQIIIS